MKVLTAKVTSSFELEVPEGIFEEGATVTLLVLEAGESFALTPEQALAVLEAISLKVTEAKLSLARSRGEIP
jgi:hypothetical protein